MNGVSSKTRRVAGIVLLLYPLLSLGSYLLLSLSPRSASVTFTLSLVAENGFVAVATLLTLTLVMLRYVDEALLNDLAKDVVRWCMPLAALLIFVSYWLARLVFMEPYRVLVAFIYLGFALLVTSVSVLGVGLIRR